MAPVVFTGQRVACSMDRAASSPNGGPEQLVIVGWLNSGVLRADRSAVSWMGASGAERAIDRG